MSSDGAMTNGWQDGWLVGNANLWSECAPYLPFQLALTMYIS
jgi:hypothetical protein